ncbi:MAG: hypothetical protein P4M05_24050 [Bradyrhizobium sp.]|nr:hypothetical protein [Bradyrhizobium sp.]
MSSSRDLFIETVASAATTIFVVLGGSRPEATAYAKAIGEKAYKKAKELGPSLYPGPSRNNVLEVAIPLTKMALEIFLARRIDAGLAVDSAVAMLTDMVNWALTLLGPEA